MFYTIFRTKEGKVLAAILGFLILLFGILVFKNLSEDNEYMEQAVMAENYLKAGSYEQAVAAYKKAIAMKEGDLNTLSIGMADAYIGLNDYDKALETLRSCYQKTANSIVKYKIEEVKSEKADYDYLQSISRAEIFFSNKEYEKAIDEYEKAKLIKNKESETYRKIAEAYIQLGEYDLAQEEIQEGLEITENNELNKTLETVEYYLKKQDYDEMITQAQEYIVQENYNDGIAKYEEAMRLLPKESAAYNRLAEIYILRKDYSKAIMLLGIASKYSDDEETEHLMERATELKITQEQRKNTLSSLYKALQENDMEQALKVMGGIFFREVISKDVPVYYKDVASGNNMLIIYDNHTLYFGDNTGGIRQGNGLYLICKEDRKDYYYYQGQWENDLPNGKGKTVEIKYQIENETDTYKSTTITEGKFKDGLEQDQMTKYLYKNDIETGQVIYSSDNGVPLPMHGQAKDDSYIIGEIYLDGIPTGEYYSVPADTLWGVVPFVPKD